MMTKDEGDVYRANEAFYSAFESLDIKEMEKVWLKEKYVQCIHPGWRSLTCWEDVMNSWRQIFENTNEMRFLLTNVQVQVRESLAWVTLYENINGRVGQETSSGVILSTNIFEKRQDKWYIIHHHGSPTMPPPETDPKATFH